MGEAKQWPGHKGKQTGRAPHMSPGCPGQSETAPQRIRFSHEQGEQQELSEETGIGLRNKRPGL